MADDPDPPRKFYELKPREFERMNEMPREAAAPPPAGTAPKTIPPPTERIDVQELIRQGSAGVPLLKGNQPANRPNEVHATLRQEYEHERAAGLYHVEPGDDKERRQRIRNYWILLAVINTPLGAIAWSVRPTEGMGPGSAVVFVCAIAGIGMFTAWWTWHNWFLRTER